MNSVCDSKGIVHSGRRPPTRPRPYSNTGTGLRLIGRREPERIGAVLESLPLTGNTPGWRKPLKLTRPREARRRLYLPELGIDRKAIAPDLAAGMNAVLTGESAWPLVLLGGVGVGKTYAALALLDAIGGGCRYFTLSDMCSDLIAAGNSELYRGGERITVSAFWHDWRGSVCVVVDEVGARDQVSDFQRETLQRAIDQRERIRGPAVFVGNLDLPRLAQLYDDRIASRLAAGTVLSVEGPDRRVSAAVDR